MGAVVLDSVPPTPAWLTGFIDDASAFPPTNLPLTRAVAEHREHRQASYGSLLGGFVVTDLKVPDLIDVLDDLLDDTDDGEQALAVNLLVTGGAGAIAPAVRWASRAPHLRLRAIQLTLRDEDDLAHNARRVLTALDAVEENLSEVEVYVELPRWSDDPGRGPTHRWLSALDEIAAAELSLTFRTGGAGPDALPSATELAGSIDAALDRELPFRATGGLVNAVSGATSYGFLNVLAATRACLDGGEPEAVLTEASPEALLTDPDALARTRRWFTGFGSGNLLESHEDLVELGLTPA